MKKAEARWQSFMKAPESERPDPELLASAIFEHVGQIGRGRVDLGEIIAFWPRLSLAYDDIVASGYLLDIEHDLGEIVIRQQDPVVRQRFTIAHEVGHWLLGLPQPSQATPSAERLGPKPRDTELEAWCDRFAAALLLPQSSYAIREILRGDLAHRWRAVCDLPARMNVSRDTAWRRVAELGIADVVQLDAMGGTMTAHYASSVTNSEKIELQHVALKTLKNETISDKPIRERVIARGLFSGILAIRLRY